MDGDDFVVPPPKRQRTNSLEENKPLPAIEPTASTGMSTTHKSEEAAKQTQDVVDDRNEMLDALMQHVESEATPQPSTIVDQVQVSLGASDPLTDKTTDATSAQSEVGTFAINAGSERQTQTTEAPETLQALPTANETEIVHQEEGEPGQNGHMTVTKAEPEAVESQANEVLFSGAVEPVHGDNAHYNDHVVVERTENQSAALQVDGIPPDQAIEPVDGDNAPEWEVDSSPYESSSDSDSSDSSDDSDEDDEDADGDYAMLDPEEAARILMQGDAGSDDEGDRSKNKGESAGLRTANEQLEDVPPVPEITITEEMNIEELGFVEAVVENNVLIKGKVSGEYQVLESGSLLCLQNRILVGVVAETLGRVEQPLYTVRFRKDQDITEHGLSEKGTAIYYVPQHSTFVFTQPLKAFKGSDASNFHDEEVGDEEMEFSDDEAEAEHKRQLKAKRQGRSGDMGRGRGSGKGGRGAQRGGYKPSPLSADANGAAYGNGSLEMNYDDVEEGEDGYKVLARPTNLYEMPREAQARSTEDSNPSHMPPPPYADRGRGRGGNHRGGRGHDRGGRGGRGNFRGHHGNNNNHGNRGSFQHNNQPQNQFVPPHSNAFLQGGQHHYSQPPSAPSITPHNHPYPFSSMNSPVSPMSPLPKSQFNFNAGYQGPQGYNPTFQQQQQQQQPQQQAAWNQQMPPGFAHPFNNPAMLQFAQQFQQSQQQQQQASNGWQVNQAAAAEVQRQLEEMRRQQGGPQQ